MEITGKVIQVLPLQSGVSKTSGKEWQLQTFVIETQEQYPRTVAIEIFGEDRIKNNPVAEDEVVTASIDIESREFNGRWYTSVRAYKVAKADTQQAIPFDSTNANANAAAPAPPAPPVQQFDPTPTEQSSELPF